MPHYSIILAAAGAALLAAPLSAQSTSAKTNQIPKEQRPPAGMCRIWIDSVPADRQPAPTDCATAIRHRPPKARVIFGDPVRVPNFDRLTAPQTDRRMRLDSSQEPNRRAEPTPPTKRVMQEPRTIPPIKTRPVRRDTQTYRMSLPERQPRSAETQHRRVIPEHRGARRPMARPARRRPGSAYR